MDKWVPIWRAHVTVTRYIIICAKLYIILCAVPRPPSFCTIRTFLTNLSANYCNAFIIFCIYIYNMYIEGVCSQDFAGNPHVKNAIEYFAEIISISVSVHFFFSLRVKRFRENHFFFPPEVSNFGTWSKSGYFYARATTYQLYPP